ncbi:hypothetical protein HC776_02705 [bacterium]|nr:hypothetical protein [bacterium]
MTLFQSAFLLANHYLYQQMKKYLFRLSASDAHERLLSVLTAPMTTPVCVVWPPA